MTKGGWLTMILSVGFVVGLFLTCILRVLLGHKPVDGLHGLDDIDTRDREP
ncbi:MAG: hypothetical protein H7A45_14460 [Verrucomicrobiales bacterium]|nr:hypothetical protein [Verrucomicrobiales bacterium]MCP5526383.1 hypothetical protein [Verrucomicrobiales bacterium]